jgi:dTDP-4-amino-4,6-dideoxygalactose transaminase
MRKGANGSPAVSEANTGTVIAKGPETQSNCLRPFRYYPNCRLAFRSFLEHAGFKNDEKVLLPAYVGWSPREGSGVFDPVRELGLAHDFYRVDDRLQIDLADLHDKFALGRVRVLVLIHYFGGVDPHYAESVALAREFGAVVVEDEAHALLTDLVGGACGYLGDACLYSLHKMLPVKSGGLLVWNRGSEVLPDQRESTLRDGALWQYDLRRIAQRRRENLARLSGLLESLRDELEPLWSAWPPDHVPQTYPVLLRRDIRDSLYFGLNAAGFGVVSLYHTLIEEVTPRRFPDAHQVSRRILNLPIHQDIHCDAFEPMVDEMRRQLKWNPADASRRYRSQSR